MPKRILKLVTIPFEQWNTLHLCVAFCPVVVVGIAMILAQIYL